MTVNAGDALRVAARMRYGIGGQELINVMHFVLNTPSSLPNASVLQDMGQVLEDFYIHIKSSMNISVQFEDYTVTNVTQDVVLGTDTWPTFVTGSGAVDALPPQCAALILARTITPRKQGRIYLPGFEEDLVAGSVWGAAALAALVSFSAEMLVTQAATFGVYSYRVFTRPDDGPPIILAKLDPPTTVAVVGFVRTQRRRSSFFGV